ncbi:ROK family protein [Streptomyces lichenis]|uniref:ROK family protein n=1 Tax=Streptomyces lichenis TaxID=2306967 RepID=A0ABT0I5L3_9ACTN|nr:ROK family protein [Streptomyces lichenis]MCK8676608.1 ROK family protein [Streptomyces lichenis]
MGLGANLPALRNHNTALVLGLLRAAGEEGVSRLELAGLTALTPQAVSKITARLRADGLAEDAGRRASTGGKPRTVLRLVPGAAHAVGLHLDRDELTAVLVDLAGTVVEANTVALDLGAGAEVVMEVAEGEVAALTGARGSGARRDGGRDAGGGGDRRSAGGSSGGRRPVLGVGVAMPGPLDHLAGVPHRVTGFPEWNGFPLRDALADRLGLPVVLDKDTNTAALALALRGREGEAGAAAHPGSFAYLHVGTGLGAGLVLDGAVYRGPRTAAGEFGHQTVQLDGPPCGCGGRGCLEALCLAAVARGDTAGAARVLGAGAANLAGLLDIDRVLLGGRVVTAAPAAFTEGVAAVLAERARRSGEPAVPVALAEDPADADADADRSTGTGDDRSTGTDRAASGHLIAEGAAQLVLAPLLGR